MSRAAGVAGVLLGSLAALGAATVPSQPRIRDSRVGPLWKPVLINWRAPRWPRVYEVTAYCSCPICTGRWSGGPTASGKLPVEGLTVAVDRRAWRLGSCLELLGVGRRVAEDTGSAIKGNRLDLYMADHDRAKLWGRRWVTVVACR